MAVDENLIKIEKLTKELETEKNFDIVLTKFNEAAALIKQALSESYKEKGKVMEIIREVDEIIEREIKYGEEN